ncbi:MAG: BlaI/MecI/CopY family transcriptional regulator [Spirochaetales bacterium]|nr:BlaI/MecI/CopY family transcriptional regulator [Spirochaetales bacterium]
MKKSEYDTLSKRERQIMDILHRRKEASVTHVLQEIADPPSYSSIRALMNIMEKKGYIKYRKVGLKYIYSPVITSQKAVKGEVKRLLKTYFDNSMEKAVAALIDVNKSNLDENDINRLHDLIEKARINE